MKAVTAIRSIMRDDAELSAFCMGDIHIGNVPNGTLRPNLALMQVGGADGVNHDGPSRFHNDAVRVYSRGDSVEDATTLSRHVFRVLHGYSGARFEILIDLIHRTNSVSDYMEDADVYRCIDDYRVHYSEA
ncbi:MAG: hypothetical protein CML31_05590 [Rhizobiales bacterium]|nr:hypothetical protein [Hoeflea sp.]MBG19426.1 hypothetical protein [Hyphomicrobiales bacterium]|tara:strand:+ start:26050 stop:26442 length:393 start_codon:yes stop_codon:yes gene_type:complete